jgi:two-component system phosphate regulon sensor histidine kinase PhoR
MHKNATPQQIAIYSTLFISGITLAALMVANFLSDFDLNIYELLFLLVVNALSIYFIFIYFLKNYIYRKIKLIYKTIHRFKVESKAKVSNVNIYSDIIGEVEKEVQDWANSSQKEIEDLRALEAYRRNFIGDISHELKTPLFNIQGYILSLLEGGINDPEVNYSFLKKAASNAERLQTIVEDLDAISKLESGEWLLDMQTFDIKELAEEVFEDLDIKARRKKIRLSFKEGADKSFFVRADLENIRQVLSNLIVNSIKYGKEGGVTKVSFYDMDHHILIEVADNGMGIAEENLPRVFDRFFRADKSRSRIQGGSGLGLSIVKHIIEAHKQTINVRSTEGYGSTFGFTLEKGR